MSRADHEMEASRFADTGQKLYAKDLESIPNRI